MLVAVQIILAGFSQTIYVVRLWPRILGIYLQDIPKYEDTKVEMHKITWCNIVIAKYWQQPNPQT